MPSCNAVDKGLKVPLPETGPTSNWSLIVRRLVKPLQCQLKVE